MAASSYPRAFAATLGYEGGYTNNPRDPGGPTNLGVTQATLSRWLGHPATIADVKALTREAVAPIYRTNYWNAVQGDALPAGVDHAVWDWGVNSGPSRPVNHLQAILGITQDGHIGPATLDALAKRDPAAVINALCDRRLAVLKSLSTWPTFKGGWSKRVEAVRKLALQLAAEAMTIAPSPPSAPPAPAVAVPALAPSSAAPAAPEPAPGFWARFSASLSKRLGG